MNFNLSYKNGKKLKNVSEFTSISFRLKLSINTKTEGKKLFVKSIKPKCTSEELIE
jgi:hypothetical protein